MFDFFNFMAFLAYFGMFFMMGRDMEKRGWKNYGVNDIFIFCGGSFAAIFFALYWVYYRG